MGCIFSKNKKKPISKTKDVSFSDLQKSSEGRDSISKALESNSTSAVEGEAGVKDKKDDLKTEQEVTSPRKMDAVSVCFHSECKSKLYGLFPKWKGYRICNKCEREMSKSFKKQKSAGKKKSNFNSRATLCKKCSVALGIPQDISNRCSDLISNGNGLSGPQGLLTTYGLANVLALTALDLTAPASDALLKNRKNAWIQLAGHPGSFAPAGPNTIWKRRLVKDNTETQAYEQLMQDSAHDIVPVFYREVEHNGEYFIEMEDLLQHFNNPNIMDVKMGKRTFLESEVKNMTKRKDLYKKMVDIDPSAPTEEEKESESITKLRYMQFREKESSTADFGFRIEAVRVSGKSPECNLKKVSNKEQIKNLLAKFTNGDKKIIEDICKKLKHCRQKFEESAFCRTHEMIGSSLLILFDQEGKVGVWMIDFSKAMPMEDGLTLTHRKSWSLGNHEDGYLTGLDNLIQLFEETFNLEHEIREEDEINEVTSL